MGREGGTGKDCPPVHAGALVSLFFWWCGAGRTGEDEVVRLRAVETCFRTQSSSPLRRSESGLTHLHGLVLRGRSCGRCGRARLDETQWSREEQRRGGRRKSCRDSHLVPALSSSKVVGSSSVARGDEQVQILRPSMAHQCVLQPVF